MALYKINVRTADGSIRSFKTKRLLSDSGAKPVRGHGTRVWAVQEIENGEVSGPIMVLKDCWINSDRRREGSTTREIVSKIEDGGDVRQHFLTVIVDGDVYVGDRPDYTHTIRHGRVLPANLSHLSIRAVRYQLFPGSQDDLRSTSFSSSSSDSGTESASFDLSYTPAFDKDRHHTILMSILGLFYQ